MRSIARTKANDDWHEAENRISAEAIRSSRKGTISDIDEKIGGETDKESISSRNLNGLTLNSDKQLKRSIE